MKTKTILCILITIILLIVIGFIAFDYNSYKETTITINNVNFTLPQGYVEGNLNKNGDINLTNGSSSIFISSYNDTNVTRHLQNYIDFCNSLDNNITISNFTIDNQVVYKTTNDNTSSEYFWFAKNGKTFSIYLWGHNDIDTTIFQLIKSTDT